jgi:hypothetical protein
MCVISHFVFVPKVTQEMKLVGFSKDISDIGTVKKIFDLAVDSRVLRIVDDRDRFSRLQLSVVFSWALSAADICCGYLSSWVIGVKLVVDSPPFRSSELIPNLSNLPFRYLPIFQKSNTILISRDHRVPWPRILARHQDTKHQERYSNGSNTPDIQRPPLPFLCGIVFQIDSDKSPSKEDERDSQNYQDDLVGQVMHLNEAPLL